MPTEKMVRGFISMWPKEVCDITEEESRKLFLKENLPSLRQPGVYVLYRDDAPSTSDKPRSFTSASTTTRTRAPIGTLTFGTFFRHLFPRGDKSLRGIYRPGRDSQSPESESDRIKFPSPMWALRCHSACATLESLAHLPQAVGNVYT